MRRCRSAEPADRLAAIVSLVASTIVLFVIGYIIFQRQEVRA